MKIKNYVWSILAVCIFLLGVYGNANAQGMVKLTVKPGPINFQGPTYWKTSAGLTRLTVNNTNGNVTMVGALILGSASDLSVNTNKFTVAAATGNTLIAGTCAITGNVAVNTNKFNITAASGNTTIAGTLGVTGNVAVNTNKFNVTAASGDVAVNTNKFNVTAASGNTAIAGTLGVASDVAINTNKFNVTASSGNTAIAGTLGVTGDVAVNTNKFNVTASSGNTAIAGTLGVTGDVAINTDKFTVTASNGNTSIAGTLTLDGIALTGAEMVLSKRQRITVSDLNTGAVSILPAVTGKKYRIVSAKVIAYGGALAATADATGVKITGTQSSSAVALYTVLLAAATQSAVCEMGTTTNTSVLADGASFIGCDANTEVSLDVVTAGSRDLITATGLDVILTYVVEE